MTEYPAFCQPQAIESLESAGGFSGARLWRIEAPGGAFCLRAMHQERVDTARLAGLHRLLAHVRSQGVIAVPVPVPRPCGSTFVEHGGWVWQLEPWMPGRADYHECPAPAKLEQALVVLARWHQAAATFVPQSAEAPWFSCTPAGTSPGISERRHILEEWDAVRCSRVLSLLARSDWPEFDRFGRRIIELYSRLAPNIDERLRLAQAIEVALQPCLRDIWHDHLLFTGNEITGLIDAHACRADNVATDIARLLGSLVGDDRAGWELGLAAYRQIRPLSAAERGLVEVFDQSAVVLSGLTWLQWRCLDGRTFDRPAAVLERLRAIVERMEFQAQAAFSDAAVQSPR